MSDLKSKINALKTSSRKEDREACIPLLCEHVQKSPEDTEAWYDLACCYDFLGFEKDAEPCYQKVHELGWKRLQPPHRRDFFVGYGSTLRNNKKFEKSEQVLLEGIQNFPDDPSLKVFLAFTYYNQNRFEVSARMMFESLTKLKENNFDGYERAIEWYAINIDSHPKK